LQVWPSLAPLSEQLLQKYPINLAGCHRLEFDNGQIILDLHFGDVQESIAAMSSPAAGLIDAWYLDGFAPSKNPEMWQQALFDSMVDLSRTA
ncbi:MnmC family methyltransferase, partial [Streptococcus suis]